MLKIKVNPNKEIAEDIKIKLKQNDGYCPCRLSKNEDTKCMCKEFREMRKNGELGECHCGLYILVQED